MLGNGWTYLIFGDTEESVDHYTSLRILRNYPAKWRIMLGNGWTYSKLGNTKQSVDHYTRTRQLLASVKG